MTNRNTQWVEIFVDELARSGLESVCLAPGSRNTPLTLAFAQHPDIKTYSHLDERSAGFFALGLALASQKTVALVCTSGTALANFYPAIVEAYQSQVPLLVLSGDRPPELRHSGANQTIDQLKIYGDMVHWFVDVALPEQQPPAVAIRNLRTLANRAMATAQAIPAGVVHLNFPFRKPLEPIAVAGDEWSQTLTEPRHPTMHTQISATQLSVNLAELNEIAELLNNYPRGLMICGPDINHSDFAEALAILSQKTGYPILADALSTMRFNGDVDTVQTYDNFLPHMEAAPAQVILRFGKLPLSKNLNTYLSQHDFTAYIHVNHDGVWADDAHKITHFIPTSPAAWVQSLNERLTTQANQTWLEHWQNYEAQTRHVLQNALAELDDFEAGFVADVIAQIPDESTVFVGNSLPVRHLDQFGFAEEKNLRVYANRGASGIDGLVSTALGCGVAQPDKPLVLIIGDISLYHDMNGLLAIQRLNIPVTIVLLNNDGGGIFNRLPIREFEPEFTDWFITSHGLDFAHSAALYGLDYVITDNRPDFRAIFAETIGSGQSTLINVKTDAPRAEMHRQNIYSLLKQELRSISAWNS